MQSGWILLALVSLGWPMYAAEAVAEGDVRSQIEHLLNLATEPSTKNLQAAKRYYHSLPAASRDDRQLQYAYAAALIRQRHLHEAAELIDKLTDEQPQLVFLWRDRVWLALAMGQKTAAMTEIEQLAAHARPHQAADRELIGDSELAEFLGGVCGFLSGPWERKVRRADAEKIEDHLRAIFNDEATAAFDRSKTKVAERYKALLKAHEEHSEAEFHARTNERQAAEQAAGRAAQQVHDKQQALKDKQKKRTTDAKARVADLDRQLKNLDDERQALLTKIAPLEAQRAALVGQMLPDPRFYIMATAANPSLRPPPAVADLAVRYNHYFRPGYHNRAIMKKLAPIVAQLTTLEAQVVALNQHEQELQFEQQATDFKHQLDVGKLAVKEQALDRDRKRVENGTRRLRAKPLGSSPRLRAEAEQLTNFSTYVPFPFEREKKRLLSEAR
ncbi:MAG TPA: hypothetical protein VFI31_14875 [Pirellulales bacterium]|nr:hypothetical protein [Pirellulales bacterium]